MPFINQDQWKSFLEEFSKRNQFRATRLEVVGNEIGTVPEEQFLPLVGVSFESRGSDAGSVVIMLGGDPDRQVEHLVEQVERIAPITGVTGLEDGLGFEDREGKKTLLTFEQLPEIPEDTSTPERASTPA